MGIFSKLIGYPLGWVMWLMYQITHNYAWAIVIFTIITRVILFPLSVNQQKSSAAMAAFQPKLEKLKKQYGNNQQKLQEEQMKLYSEEGINPMSSCLPLFIQFPILYGIFDVVYRPLTHIMRASEDAVTAATEITRGILEAAGGVPSYFDSRPEIYIVKAVKDNPGAFASMNADFPEFVSKVTDFNNRLFGVVDLGDIPTLHPEVWNASAVVLLLIPIMSGVIQLISTVYMQIRNKKMNPDAPNMAGMNLMLYILPLFSVWIAFKYPAGIGFYWTVSSLLGFAQSIILYNVYTPEYVAKLVEKDKAKKKSKKRSGLYERYQKALEEQQALQNGGVPVSKPQTAISEAKLSDDEEGESSEIKMSRSKQKEYEKMIIREARRKQAEKYGEEYIEEDED